MTSRVPLFRGVGVVIGGVLFSLALATGGGAAVAATPTPSATSASPTAGLKYVALGDSYSAGFGIRPFSYTSPADGCYQADANYPKLVAAQLGLDLTDATCSGAVTANITSTPQVTITKEGTAPIQGENLGADTQLVTVTIGGNDLGFADVAQFCVALTASGPILGNPLFANCKAFYDPDGVDSLAYRLKTVVEPRLQSTFAYIVAHAPNAKIIVVGYPAIAPDLANTPANGCFTSAVGTGTPPFPQNAFPFTDVDTPYLHELEAGLDRTIRAQAEAIGATYLPLLAESEAHSACANQTGEAYVNGITLREFMPDDPSTPADEAVFSPELGALHPNAAGVSFIQSQVVQTVGELFPAGTGGGDGAVPPTPVVPSPGAGSGSGGVSTPEPPVAAAPVPVLAATGLAPLAGAGAAGLLFLIGAAAVIGAAAAVAGRSRRRAP